MRNWLKSLIVEAVGEALTEQHKATQLVYNIQTSNTDRAFNEAVRLERKRSKRDETDG